MSESVVVNAGANAPWQVHRFFQLCLRHWWDRIGWGRVGWGGGGGRLNNSLFAAPRLAQGGYLKTRQSAGWRRKGG